MRAQLLLLRTSLRAMSGNNGAGAGARQMGEAEAAIARKLQSKLGTPARVDVEDISGGCGSMYRIDVESSAFAGLPRVRQHKLVHECLADDIKQWHGLTLTTRIPPAQPQ
eukprot:Unigene9811_Nuclearia_a/m.29962 Unigene9811_Nuclearia_a/g.29962  ORF Unigene9811_Nuclearia_a/g.29962 Unigene9811_Nuclearia_a/m.29962 type:complete len:110 (-) Unigene9811_Nuclearia_a:129-458(-)